MPAVEGTVQAFPDWLGHCPDWSLFSLWSCCYQRCPVNVAIGIVWALLSAPSAMDEAGAVAAAWVGLDL